MTFVPAFVQTGTKPDMTANYIVLGILILIVVVLALVVISKRKKAE